MSYKIIPTETFKTQVRTLQKKYPHIRQDLKNLSKRLKCHHKQSIYFHQSFEAFETESPGGFLPGITPDNVLYKKEWRNRRIAETFGKAGLVERFGQGMDDIRGKLCMFGQRGSDTGSWLKLYLKRAFFRL